MKLGIGTILGPETIDIVDLAPHVEGLGFESIWTGKQPTLPVHTADPIPREWGNIPAPFILLSRAAAVTQTLKLGTAVVVVTEHHPVTLAKSVGTLDMYSNGRLIFGIGTGSHSEEAGIFGVDFAHRWTQAREAVGAMKELWTEDISEHHGSYYDFPPVYCYPKPVQKPYPPILLGSMVPQVFGRIVAYADGWIPIGIQPEKVREGRQKLDELAVNAGRDPESIDITTFSETNDIGDIQEQAEAGADRIILSLPSAARDESLRTLDAIALQVKDLL